MAKIQLNFRIPEQLATALDEHSQKTGQSKTFIIIEALGKHLNVDTGIVDLQDLLKRLEALESKFQALGNPEPKKEIIPDELPELITKREASQLTGYSVNTLHRSLSENEIHEVSKRGHAGLYRKSEILERIGIKG
jgi:predicted DNA-binding protein